MKLEMMQSPMGGFFWYNVGETNHTQCMDIVYDFHGRSQHVLLPSCFFMCYEPLQLFPQLTLLLFVVVEIQVGNKITLSKINNRVNLH